MDLFTEIPNGTSVISTSGRYYQCPLFHWRDKIFAKHRGGFIQLYTDGGTIIPYTRWHHLEGEGVSPEHSDQSKRLNYVNGK